MTEKVIIAGAGGQGVMLLGKVLAQAALRENKFVTWLPCYGAEVRGGTAYCMVVISDKEIGSPYIDRADTLIIMNAPSLDKFKKRVNNKGLIIVNSSLVAQDARAKHCLRFPFTDTAYKLGNARVANMVALGSFAGRKKILNQESIIGAIQDVAPRGRRDLIAINQKALLAGIKLTSS